MRASCHSRRGRVSRKNSRERYRDTQRHLANILCQHFNEAQGRRGTGKRWGRRTVVCEPTGCLKPNGVTTQTWNYLTACRTQQQKRNKEMFHANIVTDFPTPPPHLTPPAHLSHSTADQNVSHKTVCNWNVNNVLWHCSVTLQKLSNFRQLHWKKSYSKYCYCK